MRNGSIQTLGRSASTERQSSKQESAEQRKEGLLRVISVLGNIAQECWGSDIPLLAFSSAYCKNFAL